MPDVTLDDVPLPSEDFCKNAPAEYREQCLQCLNMADDATYTCTRSNAKFGLKPGASLRGDDAKKCARWN